MASWFAGVTVVLLGLACLGYGPWMFYRVFTSTNQEDPSAGGALIVGVLASFTGLILLAAAASIWTGRPILGFRLSKPEDLI